MADWYVSSVAFASVSAWQATHAYSVGNFVKATASPAGKEYVWRCTVAGTSSSTEPTWSTAYGNNQTRTDGGATWTNVSGQSTYGWSAAAGTLYSIAVANSNRPVAGDRVFLSSDHSETVTATSYAFGSAGYGLIQFVSVNRAGSVPPVGADIQSGAAVTVSSLLLDCLLNYFWQGIAFTCSGANSISFGATGTKSHYFKNCSLAFTNSTTTLRFTATNTVKITFDNTTVQFANASQAFATTSNSLEVIWLNTASAIAGATIPSGLFSCGSGAPLMATLRGVDISAVTGNLFTASTAPAKLLLDSCKIAASVTRLSTPTNSSDEIELVNCYDGTNVINERYTAAGTVTTDHSTYLNGGAQDDIGAYSLKLVSSTRSDFTTLPLDGFWLDVENTATGSSKTATVEVISSSTLNDNDIRLLLEYMGTSGNPIASFGDSLATVLTGASALPSSSNTWNSPPATPQKQLLQVTFTPQRAGRVRGLVRLGKVSTTVWVNPQIAIS